MPAGSPSAFPRRDRTVEEMLLARGIVMTYEATRKECRKCGQANAHQLKRLQPQLGDTSHLDAVFLPSNGKCHALQQAVDPDDNSPRSHAESDAHKQAAKKKFVRTFAQGVARPCHAAARRCIPCGAMVPRSGRACPAWKLSTSLSAVERCEPSAASRRANVARRLPKASHPPGHVERFRVAARPTAHPCRPCRPLVSAAEDPPGGGTRAPFRE